MEAGAELLGAARSDPAAFAAFYRRHARPLAGLLLARTRDAGVAAGLTAEPFAAALRARVRPAALAPGGPQTGRTPLRFHGRCTRLRSAISSPRMIVGRVSRGASTSSIPSFG